MKNTIYIYIYISGKWYIYILETYLIEGYSKQITHSVIYNGEPHTHTCIVCGAIYIYTCEIVYIYIYIYIYIYPYIYIYLGDIYINIYMYMFCYNLLHVCTVKKRDVYWRIAYIC